MKQLNSDNSRIDRGWMQMQRTLDIEMPTKKRRYIFWIFLFFGLIGISLFSFFRSNADLHLRQAKNEKLNTEVQKEIAVALEEDQSVNPSSDILTQESLDIPTEVTALNINYNQSVNLIGTDSTSKSNTLHNITTKKKATEINNNLVSQEKLVANNKLTSTDSNNSEGRIVDNGLLRQAQKSSDINDELVKLGTHDLSILNIDKLKSQTTNLLYYKYQFPLHTGEIVPAKKHEFDEGLSIGLLSYGDYVFNFNSVGYGLGVFIEKPISKSLAIGSQLAYTINSRTSSSDSIYAQGVDTPMTEDQLGGVFTSAEENVSFLKQNTQNLNSWQISLFVHYYINRHLSIKLASGFDFFNNHISLVEQARNDTNLNAENIIEIRENKKLLPVSSIGIQYSFNGHLAMFADYRKSLRDYYSLENSKINTDRLQLGLAYSF